MGVGETGCYLYRPHAWIARVLQFDRVLVGDQDNGLLYFVNGRRNVGGVVGQGKRGIGVFFRVDGVAQLRQGACAEAADRGLTRS